jgi:hypothetical protein
MFGWSVHFIIAGAWCAVRAILETGNPAGDFGVKRVVLGAEGGPQLGFFVNQYEEMKQHPHERAILQQRNIPEEQSPAEDCGDDSDVHGIPDAAIHSGNYQMARREDRRRYADSLECEAAKAFQQARKL